MGSLWRRLIKSQLLYQLSYRGRVRRLEPAIGRVLGPVAFFGASILCPKLLRLTVGRLPVKRSGRRKSPHVHAAVHVLRQGQRVAIAETDAEHARMVRRGARCPA